MQIINYTSQRDYTISIVKSIGIIFMVIGHSGCPTCLHDYIYMFHMPLFFFCSGYFFKPVDQSNQIKHFIIKRLKKLYFPYVKWSILFLILHNTFYNINIYNNIYGYNGMVSSLYSINDYLNRFINILFAMRGSEQLLGGFWFIRVLFISSILLCIIYFLKGKYNFKYSIYPLLLISLITTKYFNISFPIIGNIPLIIYGLFFLLLGYTYKRIENKKIYNIGYFVLFTIIVVIGSQTNFSNMLSYNYTDIISYLAFATIGIISIFCISSVLKKTKIAKLLIYIGNNTMIILSLHFITFKLVSLLKIHIYERPITQLACFPVIYENNNIFWILYSLAGIFIPIFIYKIYSDIKFFILKI